MLRCWEEQPTDRPTFDKLRKTMKQMEKNNKVHIVTREYKIIYPVGSMFCQFQLYK